MAHLKCGVWGHSALQVALSVSTSRVYMGSVLHVQEKAHFFTCVLMGPVDKPLTPSAGSLGQFLSTSSEALVSCLHSSSLLLSTVCSSHEQGSGSLKDSKFVVEG